MAKIEASDAPEVIIERVFLWDELTGIFKRSALLTGLQASLDDGTRTNIVLSGKISDSSPKMSVELWARWAGGVGIHEITMVFNYPDTPRNDFEYEITPDYLREYAPDPTPLDREDIQDLRADIQRTTWTQARSEDAAANGFLFSV